MDLATDYLWERDFSVLYYLSSMHLLIEYVLQNVPVYFVDDPHELSRHESPQCRLIFHVSSIFVVLVFGNKRAL